VAAIVVALSTAAIRNEHKRQAQAKREVAYKSALNSYSATIKPGMTRKEVEAYLRGKAVGFQQMRQKPTIIWITGNLGTKTHFSGCALIRPRQSPAQRFTTRQHPSAKVRFALTMIHWMVEKKPIVMV